MGLDKCREIEEKIEKTRRLLETPCRCNDHLEIKTRKFSNGAIHYVYQCNVCGEQKGNAISKKQALAKLGNTKPAVFDDSISKRYIENRSKLRENLITLIKNKMMRSGEAPDSRFNFNYGRIDSSSHELKKEIDKILKDQEVDHAIDALHDKLRQLRRTKFHERLREINRFSGEDELKRWFEKNISRDFYIEGEVEGIHIAESVNVRADYILVAKNHLIASGFTQEPFGVEVKYFNQKQGFLRKITRGFWQAISYNDSTFKLGKNIIKPKFFLIFSNLSFDYEKVLKNFGTYMENDYAEWNAILNMANHARVGVFNIKCHGKQKHFGGWEIKFSSSVYFSCDNRKSPVQYRASNVRLIDKVRVGSF